MFTELYETPSAQGYVEEIVVNDYLPAWDSRDAHPEDENTRRRDTEKSFYLVESHLNSILTKHEFLGLDAMSLAWWPEHAIARVSEGNEDGLLALLPTLAPNVHTIHFRSFQNWPCTLLCMAQAIVGIQVRDKDESITFLTRLSKVTFDIQDIKVDFNMSALYTFAIVSSIREIHAFRISEVEPQWYGAVPYNEGYESNVTDIILSCANIYIESLNHLLGMCKKVQRFVYEPCDLDNHSLTYYRFEPDRIREALFRTAKHSLKYLKIYSHGRERTYMGSFKDFEVLTVLDTDWDLLRNYNRPARQMLTDTLPSSIEELHLVSEMGHAIDISLDAVHHLIVSKNQHFPALKIMHLRNTSLLHVVEAELVVNAKKKDITITFDRVLDPNMNLDRSDEEDEDEAEIRWSYGKDEEVYWDPCMANFLNFPD